MRDARSVYLGYGNTSRRAVAINGHDIVVLLRGQQSTVLEGAQAVLFLRSVSEVTDHMCGVRRSQRIESMAAMVGLSRSDEVYDAIFDEFHIHA